MRRVPAYSTTQLDLLRESSAYERNELEWQLVLENVVYADRENTVKFDLWNLCQARGSPKK